MNALRAIRVSSAKLKRLLSSSVAPTADVAAAPSFPARGSPPSRTLQWDEHRLTSDQLAYRKLALEFAKNEVLPFAAAWDEHHHFPVEIMRKAAGLGFGGLYCSSDVGGTELSRADGAIIIEALAYGDVSTSAFMSIHNMCCSIIDRFGTSEQRQQWLPTLISMDVLASYCLTEPSSGSDAASLQTTALRAPASTDYVLNGSKAFISGAGTSGVYVVMARTGGPGPKGISCFLVDKDLPGVSFGKLEDKLGWRTHPTAAVILDGVRVPERNRIGAEGQGFSIAMSALDGGRINIGACSVGGAQFCFDATQDYVSSRKQFGKAIIEFQNTQFKLADMLTSIEASRAMVANAAGALDAKAPRASAVCAMAKKFSTETCYAVVNDALQLHGGYGYIREYPVERYLRDLRVHTILEGTSEIMRVVVAKQVMQEH